MINLSTLRVSEYIRGKNSHEFLSQELSFASRHCVKSVKITTPLVVRYFEDSCLKILLSNLFAR